MTVTDATPHHNTDHGIIAMHGWHVVFGNTRTVTRRAADAEPVRSLLQMRRGERRVRGGEEIRRAKKSH